MQLINFVNPEHTKEAYNWVVHCAICGFEFGQCRGHLKTMGYHISEKQYEAMVVLLDQMMWLDIGPGQEEWSRED